MTKTIKIFNSSVVLLLMSSILFASLTLATHAQVTALTGSASINGSSSIKVSSDSDYNDVDEDRDDEDDDNNTESKVYFEAETRKTEDDDVDDLDDDNRFRVSDSGVRVVSATQVNTDSDLEVFKSNITVQKKNVKSVDIKTDNGKSEFTVVYIHDGKLFGVIPVHLKSKTFVEIDSDSNVEVNTKMPWWSFLVAKETKVDSDLETKIENKLKVKNTSSIDSSAEAKAVVAEEVVSEIDAYVESQNSFDN